MARAWRLLERTHYDESERTADARALAYALIELAHALDSTRALLVSVKAERDRFMKLAGYSR